MIGVNHSAQFGQRQKQLAQPANQLARVQSARRRASFIASGELLAPDIERGQLRAASRFLPRLLNDVDDLFLEEIAALFNDVEIGLARRKLNDHLRIERVSDANLQDGEATGQSHLSKRMFQ